MTSSQHLIKNPKTLKYRTFLFPPSTARQLRPTKRLRQPRHPATASVLGTEIKPTQRMTSNTSLWSSVVIASCITPLFQFRKTQQQQQQQQPSLKRLIYDFRYGAGNPEPLKFCLARIKVLHITHPVEQKYDFNNIHWLGITQ